jgi:hypothetical protein
MTDLLSKFDTIRIENKSRIDEEDKNFCEKYNKIYEDTFILYRNILSDLITLYNEQIVTVENSYDLSISMYGDFGISKVIDSLIHLKERLIDKICYHFERKYNVTIDSNKIFEKYKDMEVKYEKRENRDKTINTEIVQYKHLDYNIILDEIFIQLNGFSFQEKAIDEIKKKALTPQQYYEYRKYWNYEVKGKTIKFKINIDCIEPALYFYDNNETKIIDCYTHNKVEDYRHYDNGNTDIKFCNTSDALDFAKRYLGYIEMTEQEREVYKKKCSNW